MDIFAQYCMAEYKLVTEQTIAYLDILALTGDPTDGLKLMLRREAIKMLQEALTKAYTETLKVIEKEEFGNEER